MTIQELEAVTVGDALYQTTHPLDVYRVGRDGSGVRTIFTRDASGKHDAFPIVQRTCERVRRVVPADKRRKRHTRTGYDFVQSDGGRAESYMAERNDCTVRALANATGQPYVDAHDCLRRLGRQSRHGFSARRAYHRLLFAGFYVEPVKMPAEHRTVRQWLDSGELPARCILSIKRHVFAVVDGRVLDSFQFGSRSRVAGVYQVTATSASPQSTPVPQWTPAPAPQRTPASHSGVTTVCIQRDANGDLHVVNI